MSKHLIPFRYRAKDLSSSLRLGRCGSTISRLVSWRTSCTRASVGSIRESDEGQEQRLAFTSLRLVLAATRSSLRVTSSSLAATESPAQRLPSLHFTRLSALPTTEA